MKPRCQSFWLASTLSLLWLATSSPTSAQIIEDTTLPSPSVVTPDGDITFITGGTQAGTNLFHSFREFSVPTGITAYFDNSLDIQNIFTRVTGGSISNIDGLIAANGEANLFLLNPNGIIFGPNASLNIGGSFLAITGSAIKFADGSEFSATTPQPPPLLTISVPLGVQFGPKAGDIQNQAQATGLQVLPGKTLALLGGNVSLDGGYLIAPDGRIELGAVAGTGTIGLEVDGDNLRLTFPESLPRADISLTNAAFVDVSGEGGGNVQVQGRRVTLTDGSQIAALTFGSQPGGTLAVNASESVEMSGTGTLGDSIFSSGLLAYSEAGATGTGANITVETGRLIIQDGGLIEVSTFGSGTAGNLVVRASDSVELSGTVTLDNRENSSGLSSVSEIEATGAGGNITVETGRLIVRDGAQIVAVTKGAGSAGSLTVRASDSVELIGSGVGNGVNTPPRSGLFVRVEEEDATGAGGDLVIETGQLLLRDGAQVSTSTFGQGQGGNLIVRKTDSVEVSGISSDRKFVSGLQATVQENATGDGGNLSIETGQLLLRDGGLVTTSTFGQGNAGDLKVEATQVNLLGYGISTDGIVFPSTLSANAEKGASGTGGNLTLKADRLSVQGGAQVSTTTFSEFPEAKAGNLTVQASDVELVGVALSPDGQFLRGDRGFPITSGLFAGTGPGSKADGGTLNIETDRLSLRDGAYVQTSTLGEGDAGTLFVRATDSVELVGTSPDVLSPTSLLAVSGGTPDLPGYPEATGKGGDLTLETGELIIRDGALVTVSSLNPNEDAKGAGNIEITARTIRLDNKAQLTAETASGDGGNMNLNVQDLLLMRDNSTISTSAGREDKGGNGGNITIYNPDGFIVAVPAEDSDIAADAFTGKGGNVEITAQTVLGFQYPPERTPLSDITASSEFGLNGNIVLNTPDVDLSRGLAELPSNVTDASSLIDRRCSARGTDEERSSFTITGRGGLPPSPHEPLQAELIITNWISLDSEENNNPPPPTKTTPESSAPRQLVEAQGWIRNDKGEIVLTASAPKVTPQRVWLSPPDCNSPQRARTPQP